MIANPQFASAAPTEASGLAVLSSSPAVGAGQTLNAPFKMGLNAQSLWPTNVELIQQNAAWDIGAFVAQP